MFFIMYTNIDIHLGDTWLHFQSNAANGELKKAGFDVPSRQSKRTQAGNDCHRLLLKPWPSRNFVSFPIKKMVIVHTYVKLSEGNLPCRELLGYE